MTWELLISKGLNTALVVSFFVFIVFLLRFLYGPKGRFRDPQWDVWNEEARIKLEQEYDAKTDKDLREAFLIYARSWCIGEAEHDRHLELKIEHSFHVYDHARALAASESALTGRVLTRALSLAALFHDVARFEQYARYKSFADDLSFNHGAMGAKILMRQGFLDGEDKEIRRLALRAVALHNRRALPGGLPEDLRLVLLALRDADKLDILRVMEEQLKPGATGNGVVLLHLQEEPGSYSPSVLQALEEGRCANYRDMRYYNDFRILLCTWLFDLHFSASLRIVTEQGSLDAIIDGVAGLPELREKLRAVARGILKNKPCLPHGILRMRRQFPV